jgi:hypothetical protein
VTILPTEPNDQPGLHGMLQRLRSLGLDLMEVRTSVYEPAEDEPGSRSPAGAPSSEPLERGGQP